MDNEKKASAGKGPAEALEGVAIYPPVEQTEEKAEATSAATAEGKTEDTVETIRRRMQEDAEKVQKALEVMKEGKGVLELETPIKAGGEDVTRLPYDFTILSGLEYTDAMDADNRGNTQKMYGITYRQALNLFAAAAAKETSALDATDIIQRIGGTDATAAVQLATIFFTASIRAARRRISRKS